MEKAYLHGSAPEEQERLELMNRILNQRGLAELGLRGDERVLELGAGTAVFARDLAGALPEGSVLAVERDPDQLAGGVRTAAGVANLELRQGDAYEPPLSADEQGSFDVVHARFLLEHVERPLDVVRAMVRAVRPGGRVVLVDDDHSLMRVWPEPAGFVRLWEDYSALYGELGFDPLVGRKLTALLREAGARPTRNTMLFYGGCSGDPGFGPVIENLAEVLEGVAERLVETGRVDRRGLEETLREFRAWGAREDAALWYALPWAAGVRP